MIDDIFKVFGEQTGEILFEIITECMDDYLYIFDLQNNTFEISQSAVERFNILPIGTAFGLRFLFYSSFYASFLPLIN